MTGQIPAWAKAMRQLREEMGAWIKRSLSYNRKIPWLGGHDEGTHLSSWFGYYLLSGDERVSDFLKWMGDSWHEWAEKNLHHGYYAEGEAHHQPETFLIFLTRMLHLDPEHEPTVVEHRRLPRSHDLAHAELYPGPAGGHSHRAGELRSLVAHLDATPEHLSRQQTGRCPLRFVRSYSPPRGM